MSRFMHIIKAQVSVRRYLVTTSVNRQRLFKKKKIKEAPFGQDERTEHGL